MNRSTTSSSAPKKPSWWSRKSGLLLMAGFGVAAAWPFVSSATKLAAAGEDVTMDKVVKGAKEEKERYERMEPEKYRELKACVELTDGTLIVGTKGGLFVGKGGALKYDEGFTGGDVKGLALGADGTVWAASKKGVFQRNTADGKWLVSQPQEVHSISVNTNGEVIATGKAGVNKRGADGKWVEVLAELPADALPEGVLKQAAEEKRREKDHDKRDGKDKSRGMEQAGSTPEGGRADG